VGLVGVLTPQELVVLRRLRHFGSYRDIARELGISRNTVKTHVSHIFTKLGVNTRRAAITRAAELSLVGDEVVSSTRYWTSAP
jgi:LuxR family maltose regulon positive regulatory protein